MTPEEYAKTHQKAFRCAFDFLNEHFPPAEDDEWWIKTAEDCNAASIAFDNESLVMGLLLAVMNYLGEEYKRRKEEHGSAGS